MTTTALNRALLTAVCQASGITPGPDTDRLAAAASLETCATAAALIRRAYRSGCGAPAHAPATPHPGAPALRVHSAAPEVRAHLTVARDAA